MRKLIIFLFLPLVVFGQTTLVRWFNTDFSPTIIENHITSGSLSGNGVTISNQNWGTNNVFYLTT